MPCLPWDAPSHDHHLWTAQHKAEAQSTNISGNVTSHKQRGTGSLCGVPPGRSLGSEAVGSVVCLGGTFRKPVETRKDHPKENKQELFLHCLCLAETQLQAGEQESLP